MQRLVWQNSNGDEINLTSGNYGITNWEGFANTSLNIQSQQVPFQDGGVFLDALMEQRELSVTLAMYDGGNLETRYRLRRELMHILNPKLGEGYLIYTNDFISKRIKCVAQIPLFETHNSNDSGTPKASLAWTACDPYWEDLEETEVPILSGGTEINNLGDVPIGIKATFSPQNNEPMINPSIFNNTNGQEIRINGTETSKLIINTNMGKKEVYAEALYVEELPQNAFGVFNEYYSCYFKIDNGVLYKSNDLDSWQEVRNSDDYYYENIFSIGNSILILKGYRKNDNTSHLIDVSTDSVSWVEKDTPINFDVGISMQPINTQQFTIIGCGSSNIYSCTLNINNNSVTFGNWSETSIVSNNVILGILYNPRLNKNFIRIIYASFDNRCYSTADGYSWVRKGDINYAQQNQNFSYQKETGIMIAYGSRYGYIDRSIDGDNWEVSTLYFTINCIYYSTTMKKYIIVGNGSDYDKPKPYIGLSDRIPQSLDDIEVVDLSSFIVPYKLDDENTYGEFYKVEETKNKGFYIISGWYTDLNGISLSRTIKTKFDFRINKIQNLSVGSDMNFRIEQGRNFITCISDCTLSYRQKYIGV